MAANKFATMLQKHCHKITVILVYALLEWILILLLLLNSLFTHLIAKFANFFGLKPSCTWCSMLDKNTPKNSHFDHVCEAHATQISNMGYCSAHRKLTEAKNLCAHCSSPPPRTGSSTVAFFTRVTASEEGEDEGRCSCCDEMFNRKVYPESMALKPSLDVILEYLCKSKVGFEVEADLVGKRSDQFEAKVAEECVISDANVDVQEWDSSQTADDPLSNLGCNEDDESAYIADMLLQSAELMDSDRFICIELNDSGGEGVDSPSRDGDERSDAGEDDEQTNAVNLAAPIDGADAQGVDEAEELSGSTSEIEGGVESLRGTIAAQEKALTALYAELEQERRAAAEAAMETMAMMTKLQEEKAAMQMEAAQYQRMMEEQAEYDQEALQLLNDLMLKREKEKKELEKELQTYRNNASNDNHSINLDDEEEEEEDDDDDDIADSLAEFEEERVSILEQVKVLEAKKLLPLFDEAETEDVMRKTAMEEELGHVYERLQALEADKDFLKHCIRSMMKGNQGMPLLQEILQHLRDLKSVEILARNVAMAELPLQDALMEEED